MARGAIPSKLARCGLSTATVLATTAILADPARAEFQTGIDATPQYTSSDPAERDYWLDRTVDLNAGTVRVAADWAAIARARPADAASPADAAYDFARLDGALTGAAARGLRVMLTFGNAPDYAQAGEGPPARDGAWKPRARALGRFAHAVAARYSGDDGALPRVRHYDVWNEPNLDLYLAPQYEHGRQVSVGRYREMVNAVARGVRAVNARNQVVVGSLAPYGDPPGGSRTRPVTFLRKLFCLSGRLEPLSCPTKTHLDVLGHHPINQSGPPRQSAISPNDASSPDLSRVRKVLRAAESERTIAGERRRHPIWVTEYWWTTFLNRLHDDTPRLSRQARYIQESMYLFWKAGAKVAIYFSLPDSSGGFAAGLFLADGAPKPAAQAFAFPFVTERTRRGDLHAWGKSPLSGHLRIERSSGDGWHTLKGLEIKGGQIFETRLSVSGPARLRASVGGEHSLAWNQR